MIGISDSFGTSEVGCHTAGSARKNARIECPFSTCAVSLNVKRKIRKMKTIAIQPATEKTPAIAALRK
jgi:hypothetical protein